MSEQIETPNKEEVKNTPKNEETKSKKKQPKEMSLTTVFIIFGVVATIIGVLNNEIQNKQNIGSEIVYVTDPTVYPSLENALLEQNGMTSYYNTTQERYVLATFYECNEEYIRLDITDDDYITNETLIIEKGGTIVCYLTSIDAKTPEGFYPARVVTKTPPPIVIETKKLS